MEGSAVVPAVVFPPSEPELGVAAHALADSVVGHPESRPGVPLLHRLPAHLGEVVKTGEYIHGDVVTQ